MIHNILIVDDEEQNLELAKIILQKEGYNLLFASNGREALECMDENEIHVLVLDLLMPVMNGFETLEHVRALNKDMQTIVVTANTDKESHSKVLEMGAVDFITKPYDIVELKQKIRDILQIKSSKMRVYSVSELENITHLLIEEYRNLNKNLSKEKLIDLFEKSINSFRN
ncbi:response regulator [uncultured Sulfurimonas sp.]|jgi:DNA-binding response OmpR family regulator|uniref:response regulator n=1 Tax=uncultured Sulfurimonas sp. TaxID=291845 RepID=UPI0032B1A949